MPSRLTSGRGSSRKGCQTFNPMWEEQYLCTANPKDNSVLCLACGQVFGWPKQYNISRHYKNKHLRDFENVIGVQRAIAILRLKELHASNIAY